MRKILIATACAMVFGLTATTASALTIGDSRYIGQIVNGIPAGDADEVNYLNSLFDLAAGATAVACSQDNSEQCNRVGSSHVGIGFAGNVSGFPDTSLVGLSRTITSDAGTISNANNYLYVLGKYDGTSSLVWYIGGLASFTIPVGDNLCNGNACLSHYTLFSPTTTVTAPDGGVTIGMLGLSIFGLGYLRRRLA